MTYSLTLRAALFASALVAGGAASGRAATLRAPDPCSLVSAVEVGEALGSAIGEGTLRFRDTPTASCAFARPGGGSVAVFVRRAPSGAWVDQQIDRMRRGASLGSYRETSGVGERAFVLERRASGAALCVFEGAYYLQVSAAGFPYAAGALERLARMALGRLAPLQAAGRR